MPELPQYYSMLQLRLGSRLSSSECGDVGLSTDFSVINLVHRLRILLDHFIP